MSATSLSMLTGGLTLEQKKQLAVPLANAFAKAFTRKPTTFS